jgi:hypothetical protein
MTKLIRFCSAIAALVVAQGMARSAEGACTLVEWGYAYIKVADRDGEWAYVLKASGPQWRTGNNGWHGPGFISCRNCTSVASAAFGQIYFSVPPTPISDPSFRHTTTAAEHVEQRKRMYADRLRGVASREAVRLGPLSGRAINYRLSAVGRPSGKDSDGNESVAGAHELVISLADGCITFDAPILSSSGDGDDWTTLDSFLKEVTITKTPSADAEIPAGGTAIYRPDGKPAPSLFELKSLQGK